MKELWCLLHFLDPPMFPDADLFQQQHSMDSAEGLTSLHQVRGDMGAMGYLNTDI